MVPLLVMFQFTHPGGGATDIMSLSDNSEGMFQFTHPGRGATCIKSYQVMDNKDVSIHAPREGCDPTAE